MFYPHLLLLSTLVSLLQGTYCGGIVEQVITGGTNSFKKQIIKHSDDDDDDDDDDDEEEEE